MRSLSILALLLLACAPHREEAPVATTTAITKPPVVVPPEPVTIEVFAEWPGQGVLEVERALARPLESALREVAGVKRIHSSARMGLATIVLTLDPRADRRLSRAAVDDHLALARRSLPSDVFPSIGPDLASPASALVFALTPTMADSMQLHRVARALREALVVIPDVGEVELCGGREPRLLVTLDARRLSAYRLPIPAVVQALASSLGDEPRAPAGLLAVSATRSMEALMAVRVRPGEPAVTLGDVASITVDGATPVCDAARIGGGLAMVGLVRARHGADLQAMAAAVRAELAARRSELTAQGVTLDVFAASPLRFMLDLPVHEDPAGAKITASRSIAEELRAIGPGYAARPAFLRVTTAPRIDFDAELILESTGLGAADIAALEQRLSSSEAVMRGQLYEPSSLRFWITGEEIAANRQIAEKAAELVTGMSGVVYATARDPLAPGHVLAIKRERLAELGLSVAELGVTLAAAVDGASAGSVELDGARLPVIVRVGPSTLASVAIEALEQLEVLLPAGGKVRLTELVDIKRELEPVTISRVDGRRATRVDVTVSVAESVSERLALLQRELAASLELPVGHTLVWD